MYWAATNRCYPGNSLKASWRPDHLSDDEMLIALEFLNEDTSLHKKGYRADGFNAT